ncbi:MAG: primosomal protein N' [Erysipelotrichaceae bacterium]
MQIVHVYIEYSSLSLNRTFTYLSGLFHVKKGIRVEVPFGNKSLIGFVDKVEDVDQSYLDNSKYKLKTIIGLLDQEPLINDELFELASYMSYNYIASMISCFQVMLPAKLKPKSNHHSIKMEDWVVYEKEDQTLTSKQAIALAALKNGESMKKSEWVKEYKSVTKKLIDLQLVKVYQKEAKANLNNEKMEDETFVLKQAQKDAIEKIMEKPGFQVSLLHGVTGSGKSEVYLQLAQQILKEGKQVLILVPEISLTPQMVKRVNMRFASNVAIYHSALNPQEKYEQFKLVKNNQVKIVVGTRSSIFMPFEHLGLIVLDEEHDTSYKQDSSPRYHCRDIALWRGKYHNCKVILGSATPSLESYARAYKGNYQLVEMNARINASFPDVKMIEMRKAVKNGENYILSQALEDAIAMRLNRHEQVILLLNRRGYTPILRCIACGHVEMCPHCEQAMAYHKEDHVLKCHTCGYQKPLPYECPECKENKWRYIGVGTQRLAEIVQEKFPFAKIIRMDRDTTTKKNAHEKLLTSFGKEGDILLGTQMIAKGLDFERVSLVGIVNGDALLNRSDYRCCELTFDMLAQASGRSGRGDIVGEVLLQCYDTSHYALQCAAHHDYRQFFEVEMKYRHLAKYPPYTYLSSILCLHKDKEVANHDAIMISSMLKDFPDLKCLGPSELLKIKDEYRYRIILKDKNHDTLLRYMHKVLAYHKEVKARCRLELDMDPMMLE